MIVFTNDTFLVKMKNNQYVWKPKKLTPESAKQIQQRNKETLHQLPPLLIPAQRKIK